VPRLPRRPKTKRGLLALGGGALITVVVVAAALIYFVIFPTSSPKPFALASTSSAKSVGSVSALAGNWTIASGSQAGYRVREKLAFLPALSDAVGRTSAITGGATFAVSGGALSVTAASFVIDVETLKSNEQLRDEHIRTIGLQSATYPKASFVLSTPLKLPASALSGKVVDLAVTGVVTIHGTARRLTIPLQMRFSTSRIQAVGSLTFPWGEFKMTAPSVGGFVNVTDRATMEFDLDLKRS
jgi:polyisoprenoid-binding protein YceI